MCAPVAGRQLIFHSGCTYISRRLEVPYKIAGQDVLSRRWYLHPKTVIAGGLVLSNPTSLSISSQSFDNFIAWQIRRPRTIRKGTSRRPCETKCHETRSFRHEYDDSPKLKTASLCCRCCHSILSSMSSSSVPGRECIRCEKLFIYLWRCHENSRTGAQARSQ